MSGLNAALRVAELVAPGQFRIAEMSLSDPAPGQVQVRVTAVGVCGSDLHAFAEGAIGGLPNRYPMVLGHEPAGVIVALGDGVTGLSVGDRVACEPAVTCHHCDMCQGGRGNLCRHLTFLSQPGEPGFFRERVNLPAGNVVGLPAGISDAVGSLVEPLAVALHSLTLAGSVEGQDIAVLGAGPIGLLTLVCLRLAGARHLHAIDPVPHRRALALAVGADAAWPGSPADLATLAAENGARGFDAVFDCAAMDETANTAMTLARPGAQVILTGIASAVRTSFDTHLWRRKELVLRQVRRSNREDHAARDLLARDTMRWGAIVTHQRTLDQIADGFSIAHAYADGVGKMVITL